MRKFVEYQAFLCKSYSLVEQLAHHLVLSARMPNCHIEVVYFVWVIACFVGDLQANGRVNFQSNAIESFTVNTHVQKVVDKSVAVGELSEESPLFESSICIETKMFDVT